jgi:putative transposase
VPIEKGFTDHWLQPTGAQDAWICQFAGRKRFVWNRALSTEQARYRRGEKMVGCAAMMRQLTLWRNNGDPHSSFLKDAPVHALQSVLWELYESYSRFFKKEQARPPQFKKKGKSRMSFTESDPACFRLEAANQRVRLPKLGWVRCRFADEIVGKANSVTVRWNGQRWILSAQASQEINDGVHPNKTIVARRLRGCPACHFFPMALLFLRSMSLGEEQHIAWYQRRLKNKRRFSSNWKKVQHKIAKLHVRIANIRKDETHKFTTRCSKSHAIIVLGDLNIKRIAASAAGTMKQPGSKVAEKSGLNRAILRQGWGEIGRQLSELWFLRECGRGSSTQSVAEISEQR